MSVVHFNHSGAGLPSPETVQVIVDHLRLEAERGPMEAGARASDAIHRTYQAAAKLLGCSPQDIAFGTSHGQLYGNLIASIPLSPGDKILVSRQEWIGNVLCLQRSADLNGATLTLMASDDTSAVDTVALGQGLSPVTRIVALTWVGAGSALINPAAAIGAAIRQAGSSAFVIIDASQAIGQIPIDVAELGCDALIACGRKFLRGPRGTALAYISPRLAEELVPRSIDNLSSTLSDGNVAVAKSAQVFEFGEESVALKLGLGKAIEQALDLGIDRIGQDLAHKAVTLRQTLAEVPGVKLLDLGDSKGAAVTFAIDGLPCALVKQRLADQSINIGLNGPGYTPYDMSIRGISELLRASVHLSTSDDHIALLVNAIRSISQTGI
ncbi:aminotransferase class V-fold PLP-dependent enzyme [Ochrobactrum sp. RH2CCR150]|uniref:aminotransferase class V-fold PLP-dependent enzyme n=1 Tax=Ochrobactrum sp. RH2CCR150 TaxID=2587044 RepID=UPI0015F7C2C6|nr:selenocysteine lyase/cysteine desulfurase [Ochrobactrum sp. RH2CCR150]